MPGAGASGAAPPMTTIGTTIPPRATIRWVAENLMIEGITRKDAPTPGCWSLLSWVRNGGPDASHIFYTLHYPRLIPIATDSDTRDREPVAARRPIDIFLRDHVGSLQGPQLVRVEGGCATGQRGL